MLSLKLSIARSALFTSLLLAAAGAAQAQTVTGKITDKATGAPIPLDAAPNVILEQCVGDSDTFCTNFIDFAEADDKGKFTISTDAAPPGRYQLLAGATDYSYKYSQTFDLVTGGSYSMNLPMQPLPVAYSDVTACATIDAGGYCVFTYKLTNRTSKVINAQIWAQIDGHTNMAGGVTDYSSGNGSFNPATITLDPGVATDVSQSIYLGVRDAGSYSQLSLNVSQAGQPNETIGFYDAGKLTDEGGGSVTQQLMTPAALAAQKAASPKSATRGALQAGKASSAAAPGAFIKGTLTASDTGLPLDVSLSPHINLVTCNQPTDEFCSGSSGDAVFLNETGEYRLNTKAIPAGRYQIAAAARSTDYGVIRSIAFDAPSGSSYMLDLALPTPKLKLANPVGCETISASEGACQLGFDATNNTTQAQTLWVWVQVNAYLSGSPVGVSIYTAGSKKGMTPQKVKIAAGETVHLLQTVTFSKDLKAGSQNQMRAYVGTLNDPSHTDSTFTLGTYVVTADGSIQRSADSAQ
jgi:hypothetical protein